MQNRGNSAVWKNANQNCGAIDLVGDVNEQPDRKTQEEGTWQLTSEIDASSDRPVDCSVRERNEAENPRMK